MKIKRVSLLSYIVKDIENHMLYVNASISTPLSEPPGPLPLRSVAGLMLLLVLALVHFQLSPALALFRRLFDPLFTGNSQKCSWLPTTRLNSTRVDSSRHLLRPFIHLPHGCGWELCVKCSTSVRVDRPSTCRHHPGRLPLQHAIVIVVI